MEQRLVFFSADWARLTLVAECFMFYIHPLHWQHPYVPILSAQMLDFVMAPTAFLMGCHLNHFEEVAAVGGFVLVVVVSLLQPWYILYITMLLSLCNLMSDNNMIFMMPLCQVSNCP